MNESNGQTTADLYGWLRRQADGRRQQIAALNKEIGDLEAAMAAVAARQPAPAPPQIDRRQCGEKGCGGWLVPRDGMWVHERDGGIACFPGHSGPVAQPLDQTTRFPQVAHNGVTQVILTKDDVCAYCDQPITRDGDLRWRHTATAATYCAPGKDGSPKAIPYAELPPDQRGEPAEVSDQAAATPAQAEAAE